MRIVAFAYACEPTKGSEPGAGWKWALMLARLGDVHVITRANNREVIEATLSGMAEPQPSFSFVDLPPWARTWKRGQRGVRLYYLLWLFAALKRARELHNEFPFDVSWHLTLANVWIGSVTWRLPIPAVVGPVGGGTKLEWGILRSFDPRSAIEELLRFAFVKAARYLNPLAHWTSSKADLIFVQNPETREWLPRKARSRAVILPNAVLESFGAKKNPANRRGRKFVCTGRLISLKGAHLAIAALARVPDSTLSICGSGRREGHLRKLAKKLGIEDRVSFQGWVSRDQVMSVLSDADAYLAPAFHDQAPAGIVEAIAQGVPVLCLDSGGGPVIAGDAGVVVPIARRPGQIVMDLASAMNGSLPETTTVLERARELCIDERTKDVAAALSRAGLNTGGLDMRIAT